MFAGAGAFFPRAANGAMITTQNANAYFAGHTLARAWDEYSGAQKDAAILRARRELSRELGRPMRDDEPAYKEGDQIRDEYAVYEQAAYLLLRDVHPEGSGSAQPVLDAQEAPTLVPQAFCGKWSRDALRWLGTRVNTRITT